MATIKFNNDAKRVNLKRAELLNTLLLHHNLTSAQFLGKLIEKFKKEAWMLTDAEKAYQDPIFQKTPKPEFAGESLIYSMARQTRRYDGLLRYPAEDGRYEKERMNELEL